MRSDGFLETLPQGNRSLYGVTDKGRSLEPIISSIARWWVHEGINALDVDATKFSETSALSVLETLPNLLREEQARDAHVVFEIRLSGPGGGVWTVEIRQGRCEIRPEFAEGADVRYTATARDWCAVALGVLDAREAVKSGRLHKEGGPQAMDEFFHQIARPRANRQSKRQGPKREGEAP
jgi:putative sterol carrier protein